MSSKLVKTFKLTLISALMTSSLCLNAMAAQNLLSAVEIKNSENGYQVLLRADKATEVRKTTQSSDDVILELRGVSPLESVGTIYNNVPEIDNVMIEPLDNNNTRVLIHGKNIATANISFKPVDSLLNADDQSASSSISGKNEIELSQPIQNYAPVTHRIHDFEDNEANGMFLTALSLTKDSVGSAKPIAGKLLRYILKLDKKVLAFGGLFSLIIIVGLIAMKPNEKNEIKDGLSQSLKDRELEMRSELSLANELQTLRNRKQPSSQPAPSINYGLKAYQNSQRNPYTSQISGLAPRKPLTNNSNRATVAQKPSTQAQNQAELQMKLRQARAQQARTRKPLTAPEGLRPVSPVKAAPGMEASSPQVKNVDSIKFLESMTKIYERSGRADLANELKANIQKVQVAR